MLYEKEADMELVKLSNYFMLDNCTYEEAIKVEKFLKEREIFYITSTTGGGKFNITIFLHAETIPQVACLEIKKLLNQQHIEIK